jgi:hypothetical protein
MSRPENGYFQMIGHRKRDALDFNLPGNALPFLLVLETSANPFELRTSGINDPDIKMFAKMQLSLKHAGKDSFQPLFTGVTYRCEG